MNKADWLLCICLKTILTSLSPNFPVGIYSISEVSLVGKNENQLIEENTPMKQGLLDKEISRGNILDDKVGVLKLIVHRDTKQILGVHIRNNATRTHPYWTMRD